MTVVFILALMVALTLVLNFVAWVRAWMSKDYGGFAILTFTMFLLVCAFSLCGELMSTI